MLRLRVWLVCGLFVCAGPQPLLADEAPPPAPSNASSARVYREAAASVVMIRTPDGLGSGVIVDKDGSIVTNLHVVGDFASVEVILKPADDGKAAAEPPSLKAAVIRRDEIADLALIRLAEPPPDLRPLAIAEGRPVAIGATVHAIGHPEGYAWTYTRGFVSQVRRDYEWSVEDHLKHRATVIQTQTPISPGSSGGPLLDDRLRVIGINTFTHDGEGLHFAISAEDVAAFLARTDDRRAPRDGPPAGCVRKILKTRASDSPRGEAHLIDEDCDGVADYEVILPADRRQPLQMRFDKNGDGLIDMTIIDRGRDGNPDEVLYDVDGDGEPDYRGVYRRGELKPYRVERIDR